jgi:hypothetical protein
MTQSGRALKVKDATAHAYQHITALACHVTSIVNIPTDKNWLAHEIQTLKSNFELMGGNIVRFCMAVKKFRRSKRSFFRIISILIRFL